MLDAAVSVSELQSDSFMKLVIAWSDMRVGYVWKPKSDVVDEKTEVEGGLHRRNRITH